MFHMQFSRSRGACSRRRDTQHCDNRRNTIFSTTSMRALLPTAGTQPHKKCNAHARKRKLRHTALYIPCSFSCDTAHRPNLYIFAFSLPLHHPSSISGGPWLVQRSGPDLGGPVGGRPGRESSRCRNRSHPYRLLFLYADCLSTTYTYQTSATQRVARR